MYYNDNSNDGLLNTLLWVGGLFLGAKIANWQQSSQDKETNEFKREIRELKRELDGFKRMRP